jgi:hypothetical protein
MFEGRHLFSGKDPEHQTYRSRAHLASMISLLGHPPQGLIRRGAWGSRFFSEKGAHEIHHETVPEFKLTCCRGVQRWDTDTPGSVVGGDGDES